MKIFEKLGIKKADEMERNIQLKAIRLAWVYTVLFLVIWVLYESYQARLLSEKVNLIPGALLVSQNLVLILTQLLFRFRMTSGEDEAKKKPFLQAILIIAIVIAVVVALGILTRFIIG